MSHKKVIIITYYWPPSGGSGVQRWLKMAKYLPQFGWEPVVFTPENPELMARDEALLHEVSPNLKVWKLPIFEPYNLYKIFTGKRGETVKPGYISDYTDNTGNIHNIHNIHNTRNTRNTRNTHSPPDPTPKQQGGRKESRQPWKERLSLFIRGNFFFPDPRCFWRRPSVRYLVKRLKEEPVDCIITTGPPHSMHLIGKDLHRKTGIPWMADFRDPWTGFYYFKHLKMLPFTVKRHKRAEQAVVSEADIVTVVSPQMRREFLPLNPKKVEVIPNGYDESDFAVEAKRFDGKFTITHTGLFTRDANPDRLWQALAEIVAENEAFAQALNIVLVGQTDNAIKRSVEEAGLLPFCRFVPYVPHLEAVAYQKGANLLLLTLKKEPESKGIITGKLFEYLAAGKPILAIGPVEGDLSEILTECNGGTMHEFEDFEGIKRTILLYFRSFGCDKEWEDSRPQAIAAYSRQNLCGRVSESLNQLFLK